MNVLIPMAGAGSRFAIAGYTLPKPLIEIKGKPMIQVVVENLNISAKYTYVVRKEHYENHNLYTLLKTITPDCNIICVDRLTEGAACTTLLAKEFINTDDELIIANCDQVIEWESDKFVACCRNYDGCILTFPETSTKCSYAKVDNAGIVTEVKEKQVISQYATVGIYYWKNGNKYVECAEKMISKNIRTNNEFYVCPVYNEGIEKGMKFGIYNVEKVWATGTPEDLTTFLNKV